MRRFSRAILCAWIAVQAQAGAAQAQQTAEMRSRAQPDLTYGFYGTPGLIDMPTAQSAPDGEISATVGYFGGQTRTTLSFQILPRLSGSFRYAKIDNYNLATGAPTYDRSFDLRFRLLDEGRYRPAVAVGLQDFIGTGIYSGEYLVATKHIGERIRVTGGLGWGRLGSYNSFDNPLGVFGSGFDTRPAANVGLGGTTDFKTFFRGPAAAFAGIEYRATDRLSLKAEYSSDDYTRERLSGFSKSSPFNFGLDYRISDNTHLGAYYLYGSELGVLLNYTLNPRRPPVTPSVGPAPVPVAVRAPGAALDTSWIVQEDGAAILRANIATLLAAEGMALEALALSPRGAEVRFRNLRYGSVPQAFGRLARILTNALPASVERFTLVPVENGIALSSVTLARTDLEQLEFAPDGAWQSYVRATLDDGTPPAPGTTYAEGLYPKLTWGIGPYAEGSSFDPDSPLRLDVGLEASARYEARPGLIFSGAIRKKIVGNLADSTRVSNSVLPHVRSDANVYAREGDPAITSLTGAYYFRPGENLYGRVTAGYLETMYGGISGELLWKRPESPLALGVELNYARQRDFDQLFGFQNYDVITGHVSGYWDMGNGFYGQIDVGRYLAGDYGATFTLKREFGNGWAVGAYATFTDVPFSRFGEGSFDKGILFTVPLAWFTGTPTTRKYEAKLQPLLRDGGARLNVEGRLYESVRDYQDPVLREQWGRFWR